MGKGGGGSGTERGMVRKKQAEAEGAPIKSHECPAGHTFEKKKGGEADVRQQAKRANAGEEDRGHNVQSDLRVFKEGHGNGG